MRKNNKNILNQNILTATANTIYVTYLVIAVLSLHLLILPLCFSVRLYLDSDKKICKIKVMLYFLPIFVKKVDWNRLTARLTAQSKESDEEDKDVKNVKKHTNLKRKLTTFLIGIGIEILKRLRVRDFELDSLIGTGDAAATAYAVGSAKIALSQCCAYFNVPDKGIITPDYDATKLFVSFSGIFSLCFGDIIYAVGACILSNMTEHGKTRRDHEYGSYARKI